MNEAIDLIKKSAKAQAYISNRDDLYYGLLRFGPIIFHLPPQTQDSAFNLDLLAIAM